MHTYAGNPASYPASISLPDDGADTPSFVNLNTAPEGLADRTAYLAARINTLTGEYKISNVVTQTYDSIGAGPNTWDHLTFSAADTWTDLVGGTTFQPFNFQSGDYIDFEWSLNNAGVATSGGGWLGIMGLFTSSLGIGVTPSYFLAPGSMRVFPVAQSTIGVNSFFPMRMNGTLTLLSTGTLWVKPMARLVSTIAPFVSWNLSYSYSAKATLYRGTGVAQ
jgi:hypothetical protein